jgi:Domain of unknown function (DUF1929)/Bacterial Ig domain/Glyoxal oxidase N-terminus/Kelch motif
MVKWAVQSCLAGGRQSLCAWVATQRRRSTGVSALRHLILLLALIVIATTSACGSIALDANVSKDSAIESTTIVSPAISTLSPNELILAFIETDYLSGTNTTVTSVVGGGLTWTLVVRANAQSGSSEIWRAFAATPLNAATATATLSQSVVSSMTVMSFAGVNTSGLNGSGAIGTTASKGASTGAPTASLVTTASNSMVLGVGNDYDNALARTLGTGQSLVHQYLTPSGDTYWVQASTNAVPLSGTSVTISDTAPTKDRFNLAIVEVVAAPSGGQSWSIFGAISPITGGAGATVTLGGASSATAVADANGNYTFTGQANGSYTITPSKTGFTFTPASQPVSLNGANQTGINFTAQAVVSTWNITGTISGAGGSGATVSLTGASSATVTADASGVYTFTGLTNGSYTVTPSKNGFTFNPVNRTVTVSGANQSGVNFSTVAQTYSISGIISPVAGGSGATVMLSGAANATVLADASGNYSFAGLANGTYTVTPSNAGFTFSPTNSNVILSGATQSGINFTAQPTNSTWSITGSISPAAGGSGATVTLGAAANATAIADANGNYNFTGLANGSYTVTPVKSGYTFNPSNQPVTVSSANVSGINFTAVAPSNSIALDVNTSKDGAASATITSSSFSTSSANELILAFISTDYLSGTNTTVKSISGGGLTWILVVRANGQSGTSEIWRAFAATSLSSVTVTASLSQSVVSSMTVMSFSGVSTSGTNGTGAIGATASQSAASGAPTASLVSTGSNSWLIGVGNDYDNATTRTVGTGQSLVHQYLTTNGDTYWVQRQINPIAASGTVVAINDTAPTKDRFNLAIVEILSGGGGSNSTPPTVSMTSPAQGGLVSSMVSVSAIASDNIAVAGVQFLLDGTPLGAEITTPPYAFTWDSSTVSDGPHTLAARARDSIGLATTSTAVAITVSNSSNSAVVGSWSSVVNLPAVAVNLILLQNNKVLFYQDGSTPTVWDYVVGTFNNIPAPADLFCSGHALLSDGRVLVVGGYGESATTIGINNAEIFDPSNGTWRAVPNMQYRRWYPGATTLSDGRILVTAGWQSSAHTNAGISEIYDPVSSAWTQLTNANNPFETYPFLYLLPDGRVIHIGGSEYPTDTDVLDLSTKTWSVVDPNILDGGSATMYLPGRFMKAGSAADSQTVGASSNTTFVLDMTQPSPAWRQTASMAYPRTFLNLTTLPDGSVLATGGETDKNGGKIANAVYAAELWSPQTQTWSTMAAMHTPREYHGTALLLPDGRVLESGMGADFGNVPDEKSAEFYSPPYLFKGPRPSISQAPTQIGYGAKFFVGTPDGANVTSVSLIRTGAVTHFFDQNSRYIPLSFAQTSGGLTVTAPINSNLAPPGYYMLFLVNSAGVPSVAPFVQVQ